MKTEDLSETHPEIEDPEVAKEFQETMKRLREEFKRIAYRPVVKEVSPTHSTYSKIGGLPYLRDENDWPICPNCGKHLQLFLQLNLSDLPERQEEGLIQMFYCTSTDPLCEDDLEAWEPFSEGVVCRKIEIGGASAQVSPLLESLYPEKQIVNWEAFDDYPDVQEYEDLGIELEYEDEIWDLLAEREEFMPADKDKLFGWPHWIQGIEYPEDRETGSQMDLLFQFDSEDNLPHMFGDAGVGHLTQSPDNKKELAFGWACS